MSSETALRRDVVGTARALNATALSPGMSGNVSVRIDGGCLITPSGVAYDKLLDDDIVALDSDGRVRPGARNPSTEWHFHCAIYRARDDIAAIVHSHSPSATALACTGRGIPAFHYMVAVAGGADIRCAPYATFGTEALAAHAVTALADRRACLLANHGQIACGTTLGAALALAQEVEVLAGQYMSALQIGGVQLLDAAEMARVAERFKSYGKRE